MPGRDYNKAYALFEQSLGDSSYPTYPTTTTTSYRYSLSSSTKSKSFAERSRLSSGSTASAQSQRVETHLLPPTPPPGAQSQDPSFGLANRLTTPELTPDTRNGTPFTNLEAPTPNTTPPSLASVPAVKHPRGLSYDSSRAESFRTAREDNSPHSDVDSPIDLPLQGVKTIEPEVDSRVEAYAIGLRNFDRVTEQAHRRFLQEMDLKRRSLDEVDTLGSVKSSTHTSSTRKRRRIHNPPKELTFLEDAGLSLKSPTNQDSPASWLDGSSSGENSPVVYREPREEPAHEERLKTPESKIISTSPEGSPIVEASIVDSPPRRERTLRHVSKNAELRRSPPQGKAERVLVQQTPVTPRIVPSPEATMTAKEPDLPTSNDGKDSSPSRSSGQVGPSRSRSLLSPRVPSSIRSKWRRSAPGLMAWDSPAGLTRGTMEAVPEDKPLPESPQPAAAFDVNEVPSQRRSSEHSITLSDRSRLGVDRHVERASSRNTFARSSPVSDASEALVGDATAINIYPHHNESLVVVEHPGSSSSTSKETATLQKVADGGDNAPREELETPVKKLKRNSRNVESPLTNPRRPPEPPAVSIIPPTPAKNVESEGSVTASPTSTRPLATRQRSLSQRAKRYSGNFVNTFSVFTSGSRSKRSSAALTSPPETPTDIPPPHRTHDSLYPTWRPRGHLSDIEPNVALPSETLDSGDTTQRLASDASATENTPPSSYHDPPVKPERRLSLRRLLSNRSRKGEADTDTSIAQRVADFDNQKRFSDGALVTTIGSQRRGLTHSLRERLAERSIRREEQRHQERQEKLRHSIGTRFYVEHGGPNAS